MSSRNALLLAVSLTGIIIGVGVVIGPWLAYLFVDDPVFDAEGPFNLFLIILGLIFAAPSIVLLAARRRFTASLLRMVIAVLVGGGISLFELLMIAIMMTDGSGDGQVALILLVPIPFALLAAIVLGITAAVGRRATSPVL